MLGHHTAERRYTVVVVRGDVLDLILIVVVAAFAVSGYRQGFIVGVLSFFGFVGGALLGAEFGPSISRALVGGQTQQDVIAVVLLVSFAVLGQFIASSIGAAMRSTVTWRSATVPGLGGRVRRQHGLGAADRLGGRIGAERIPVPGGRPAGEQLGGAADAGQVHALAREDHVLRLPQAAGQQQHLRRGVQRDRRGAHPRHPGPGPQRADQPAASGRPRSRVVQGAGGGAELPAVHRGLRLRHLTGPHPDQRARGGRGDAAADGHHRRRPDAVGHRGVLRPAGGRGRPVRARAQPDPAAVRRAGQSRRQRRGRGLPAGRPDPARRRRPGSAASRTRRARTSTRPAP